MFHLTRASRIGIVGAGPAGLCSGAKLKQAGFENVKIRPIQNIRSGPGNSLTACKQKCDKTQGCGAVSWNGNYGGCFMTSQMKYTTSESGWECYSKGCS